MQPAGGRPHVLGYRGGERNDVVLGGLLDGFDAGNIEGAAVANVARGFGWNQPRSRDRLGGCRFNEQPRLVTALVAPDTPHLRMGIACDHVKSPPPGTPETRRTVKAKPADISRARASESNGFEPPRP